MNSRLRLRGYNDASPANCFGAVSTRNRTGLFSDVWAGMVLPTTAGLVVEFWWHSISLRFPEVQVDAVVVMPNHLHGIFMLGTMADDPDTVTVTPLERVMQWFNGTSSNDSIPGVRSDGWPRFDRRLRQKGEYEHIIGSDRDLDGIRDHIAANLSRWHDDEYHLGKPGP